MLIADAPSVQSVTTIADYYKDIYTHVAFSAFLLSIQLQRDRKGMGEG